MSDPGEAAGALPALAAGAELGEAELKACCATAYENPAVRWLLGGELHPGGAPSTRRALELAGLRPGMRLLDVASGSGTSALLAASEFGADAVGVEFGKGALEGAGRSAAAAGLAGRVEFRRGDAESLPVEDGSFDVVLCECSLCTFPDKGRAAEEFRRALRPGGRMALSDVVVEGAVLPEVLRGAMATIACVGGALPSDGYRELLAGAGLEVEAIEPRREDVDLFLRGIEDRLRGARLLGMTPPAGSPLGIEEAIEATRQARAAAGEGALGYAVLTARAR